MKFFCTIGVLGILIWIIGEIATRLNSSLARSETFHWITFISMITGAFSLCIYSLVVRWRWADYMRRTGTERVQDHIMAFIGLIPPKKEKK